MHLMWHKQIEQTHNIQIQLQFQLKLLYLVCTFESGGFYFGVMNTVEQVHIRDTPPTIYDKRKFIRGKTREAIIVTKIEGGPKPKKKRKEKITN